MLKNRLIIAGLVMCLILAVVPSVLSAASSSGQVVSGSQQSTAPEQIKQASTASVVNGVATSYWLELKAYPSSNTRALWLKVDNDWRYLSNPSSNIETSVQNAFANPDIFQVKVWYSGQKIVGLVVITK